MPLKPPSRPLASTICRQCRQRLRSTPSPSPWSQAPIATVSTRSSENRIRVNNVSGQRESDTSKALPRWARTPDAMKAPVKARPRNLNDEFPVNEDPKKLDNMYIKMLGHDGDQILPEDIKWLAVTHKSFDHGRRGFNDRLAFLGKRIVELQTSLALLDGPAPPHSLHAAEEVQPDQYGRLPFQHDAVRNVENITTFAKQQAIDKKRLAGLAERYGLAAVIRWKPREIEHLKTSGLDTVLAHTMYAIIGAIALQRGGEVANQTVRHRILNPLGLV